MQGGLAVSLFQILQDKPCHLILLVIRQLSVFVVGQIYCKLDLLYLPILIYMLIPPFLAVPRSPLP